MGYLQYPTTLIENNANLWSHVLQRTARLPAPRHPVRGDVRGHVRAQLVRVEDSGPPIIKFECCLTLDARQTLQTHRRFWHNMQYNLLSTKSSRQIRTWNTQT